MPDLKNVSVKISNYKGIGEEEQGFDRLLPVNVIIGRNNSGKSTLLELVQCAQQEIVEFGPQLHHGDKAPRIIMTCPLAEEELRGIFHAGTRGGVIPGNDHWEYGKQWVGKQLKWQLGRQRQNTFLELTPPLDLRHQRKEYENNIAKAKRNPFEGAKFKQLSAERNIVPETDNNSVSLLTNGQGATNFLQAYINKTHLPRDLVRRDLLEDLNKICRPDSVFLEVVCRQAENGAWEVYLQEDGKGLISLSNTGSGFKTILLVLINLHLVPHSERTPLSNYIFAFEELENNLHPAMLRKLLLYLRQKAVSDGCTLLLTTHSSVVIDLFSKDENAQMIHVTHDGKNGTARRVATYVENRGILDDLDVRASDLLQANGVIWVEGPSDRIYLNRWISLWSGGELKEGTHYQCVFYGGKLLAHLSGEAPAANGDEWVNILRVNRNAIIVIDSDKTEDSHPLNKTKERVKAEIEAIGGSAWVTEGRTIENYIPVAVLSCLYPEKQLPALKKYSDLGEYLESVERGAGREFQRNKVVFAERVCQVFRKEHLVGTLDLETSLEKLCAKIRAWNRM